MKLFEHEAKKILSAYGVQVPRGELARGPEEALKAAMRMSSPYVVKAQVLVAVEERYYCGGSLLVVMPNWNLQLFSRLFENVEAFLLGYAFKVYSTERWF